MSQPAIAFPARRRAERLVDVAILGCGLAVGLMASAALLAAALERREPRLILGIVIYIGGLLAMLGCSLLFHATAGSAFRQFFRRLDHAAIFAMIAGSATPFALGNGSGVRGYILAAAIWGVAAVGIAVKLRLPIGGARRSVIPYLLLGWLSVVAVGSSATLETAMWITAGGVLYSIGVAFYLWRRLPYHSAVWHAFVLGGAACHYLAVLGGVVFA